MLQFEPESFDFLDDTGNKYNMSTYGQNWTLVWPRCHSCTSKLNHEAVHFKKPWSYYTDVK